MRDSFTRNIIFEGFTDLKISPSIVFKRGEKMLIVEFLQVYG